MGFFQQFMSHKNRIFVCIISDSTLLSSLIVTFRFLIPEKKDQSSDYTVSMVIKGVWSHPGSVSVHSGPPLTDVVMQCHRPPLDWNMEEERPIQRMATRGGRERGRGK